MLRGFRDCNPTDSREHPARQERLARRFWAFDGWYSLTFVAGEIKDPTKNIPRASLIGISVVTVLYILINLAYFAVLTPEQIQSSDVVAADSARVLFEEKGVKIISVMVILSILG